MTQEEARQWALLLQAYADGFVHIFFSRFFVINQEATAVAKYEIAVFESSFIAFAILF